MIECLLWGKSRHLHGEAYSLVWHLVDAAAAAGYLWDVVLSPSVRALVADGLGVEAGEARRLVMLIAGCHDLGKVTPGFQGSGGHDVSWMAGFPAPSPGEVLPHDRAVGVWLGKALRSAGFPAEVASVVAQLLSGHHGRFWERLNPRQSRLDPVVRFPSLGGGEWEGQRVANLAGLFAVLGDPVAPAELPLDVAVIVCGLVVLADWLVSDIEFVRGRLAEAPKEATPQALKDHLCRTEQLMPGLVGAAGLSRLSLRPGSIADEFTYLAEDGVFTPNALQSSIAQTLPGVLTGPGLLLVMSPTGSGKTETALHAARLMGEACGVRGLSFTLPTMSNADGMYLRLRLHGRHRSVGRAPLGLLHSMSMLNDAFTAGPGREVGEVDRLAVTDWLRERVKSQLGAWDVGTVDQKLMAVLPVRFNALRLLGLTDKVLVVDEAHAYDAYTQGLLRRLLTWLGRLGVPVVLLSATVSARIGRALVGAYLEGAGLRCPDLSEVSYPGWVYADGRTGAVTCRPVDVDRRNLNVDVVDVAVDGDGVEHMPVLRAELAGLIASGGCALVVCATVAQAQRTHAALEDWFAGMQDPPALGILHAAFPMRQRRTITDDVMRAYGKDPRERPSRSVLVATAIVETSLDLDFDLILSDAAALAPLLQRAGRGQRHPAVDSVRPAWAAPAAGGVRVMRMVVMIPPTYPYAWTVVSDESLLVRTETVLRAQAGAAIRVPEDVQGLIDDVYDDVFITGATSLADAARVADETAREQIARARAIPAPADITDLEQLTADLDEDLIATRLGVDTVRVLCCQITDSGQLRAGEGYATVLPAQPRDTTDMKLIMDETISVRGGAWQRHLTAAHRPPAGWLRRPLLRELVILPVDAHGRCRIGTTTFHLHPVRGLIRRTPRP